MDCEPCLEEGARMTATIDEIEWQTMDVSATVFPSTTESSITIDGKTDTLNIQLTYLGPFGIINNQSEGFSALIYNDGATESCNSTSGTITFDEFDQIEQVVSGSFEFECTNNTTGDMRRVLSGTFTNVPYQQ